MLFFSWKKSRLLRNDVDIWFADESGFERDPRPHRAHLADDQSTLVQQLRLQKWRKIIRAFGSGHIGCYRQPGENPTNHRYRNVILTNALAVEK